MSDVALIQGLLIGGPYDNAEVDAPDSFLPVIVAGDPDEYYFRITPQFETGSSKYAWLNKIIAVGIGDRQKAGPIYYVHEIL